MAGSAARLTSTTGNIALSGSGIALDADSQITSAGDLDIVSRTGDVLLGRATAGGRATVNSAGSLLLNRAVASMDDLDLRAVGAISVADGALVASAAKADVHGASLAMGAGSRLDSAGQMHFSTTGDMQLAALQTDWDGTDAVRLISGGNIVGRTDTPVHLRATGANAQGSISAVTGIGDPLVIDMPWLSAETLNGDINIVAEQGLYSPFLRARNGNVTLRVDGSLTFGELIGNPYLWVDGVLDGDLIVMQQGKLASSQGLNVRQIELNGGGPLVLEAPTIDVGVDSKGAADTFMTLSGFEGGIADRINVQVVNTGKLNVKGYRSSTGSLSVDGELNLDEALVVRSLAVRTAGLTLDMNNYDPRPLNVNGQLMSPDAVFWLDTLGFELRTNALPTRYADPLVMFLYKPGVPQDLQVLAFQRLSAEYNMLTRLNDSQFWEAGLGMPGFPNTATYQSPMTTGSGSVNTGEPGVDQGVDLPPADEELLEISSR